MPDYPLPGYVDTGITKTVTVSADLQVLMRGTSHPVPANPTCSGGGWSLLGRDYPVEDASCAPLGIARWHGQAYTLDINGDIYVLEDVAEECDFIPPDSVSAPAPSMSSVYHATTTDGPFRLGVRYELIDPLNEEVPKFAQKHYRLKYSWFADADTKTIRSMGPLSYTTFHNSGTETPGDESYIAEIGPRIGANVFSAFPCHFSNPRLDGGWDSDLIQARVTNLVVDGHDVDTTTLPGDIGNGIEVSWDSGPSAPAVPPFGFGAWAAEPPYVVTAAPGVSRFGTAAGGIPCLVTDFGTVNSGASVEKTFPIRNWVIPGEELSAGVYAGFLSGEWAAEQDPPHPPDDLRMGIRGACARHDPSTAGAGTYHPLSLAVAAEMTVLRSDNPWVSSDTEKIDVTGSSLSVTEAGAQVTRQMAEHWREWTGERGGKDVDTNPLFRVDGYEVTKHAAFDSGEDDDVWGWAVFTRLRVNITAPAAGTLLLKVGGVTLEVTDGHKTGSTRVEELEIDEQPYSVSYDIPVVAGANTVTLDLAFPSGSGPFYHDRVDTLTLSGFAEGAYSIGDFSLVVLAGNVCAIKIDPHIPPVQRQNYDTVVLAVDGSFAFGNWPDQTHKTETGPTGGGVRFVNILTGAVTGLIQDSSLLIENVSDLLDKHEGLFPLYNVGEYAEHNADEFATFLGPELAQWLRPQLPVRYFPADPGDPTQLEAAPLAAQLSVTNCQEYRVAPFQVVDGGEDVLAKEGGHRAPAGRTIEARKTGSAAVVATAVTNASGYAVLAPLPAGEGTGYTMTVVEPP